VRIPINENGEIVNGWRYWQQKVKEMAYCHLDVSIYNFKTHLQTQWDAIHAKFGQLFRIEPPLKLGTIEKYMQECGPIICLHSNLD
jgi:hypothetical protein